MRRTKLFRKGFAQCASGVLLALIVGVLNAVGADTTNTDIVGADATNATNADNARFSDKPAPLVLGGFPQRPPPLIELGDKFLGSGNLQRGITLPTGEVISPDFWVFGTLRSAVQTFDPGQGAGSRTTEWANRLDIFGNLQFTPTERILAGWRPFDRLYPNGVDDFSGYRFGPTATRGWQEDFGATPQTLFFEGQLDEIFPGLEANDRRSFDYGFAVGRQPLTLQDGILVNDDNIDMVSVTRNSLLIPGGSTLRLSGLVAFNNIYRPDYATTNIANARDHNAVLAGLDAAADFPINTVQGDLLYETSPDEGSAYYLGLGSIQRIGKLNTTFRVNSSIAADSSQTKVTSGTLLTAQLSYTLPSTVNFVYMDGYWGIGSFSSAARDPTEGGPLGDVGLLTAAVGLGQYGAPLSNQPDREVGGAIGYQMFFGELHRTQVIIEVGGQVPTDTATYLREEAAGGIAVRFQRAFGQRFVFIVDTFGVGRENSAASAGGRVEWETKF